MTNVKRLAREITPRGSEQPESHCLKSSWSVSVAQREGHVITAWLVLHHHQEFHVPKVKSLANRDGGRKVGKVHGHRGIF